ncbi:phosphotransferase enzyme family protein [Haloferula sp. A504]|uniref:phosphotransferase enzyme family protein n=1 Tax=Haloferula sp. A504 TaxID=3373601 RepID=UPI0031C5BD43|nr:aminoglycoside phosphotransferase family protein [Verrucomicrobiaceae bacterium E54]
MHDLEAISSNFLIPADFQSAEPYGSGHINDTYAVRFSQAGTGVRYIFQRINHHVFPDPVALMRNIERVCAHSRSKLGGLDASRQTLTLIPTRDLRNWHVDGEDHWRCYLFIENARTYDAIRSLDQATEAARAFGRFQGMLADLPGGRLSETIPDFHHTRKRFENLVRAFEADAHGRAGAVAEEMAFIREREADTDIIIDALESGRIPERITHNDTKLNNVMIDDATGEGICVIDLDTVMPGTALNDFGDMIRTATNPAREDSRDLSEIRMRPEYFEAIARGYLEGASGFLTESEIELLPVSGKLMTLEVGIRFLTDFLEGDIYFKTQRDGHNLDRCRSQLRLVESIEGQMDDMKQRLDSLTAVF